MSSLADPKTIEQIVDIPRHPTIHYGIAVSEEKTVYILHSQGCINYSKDLRECRYSKALDAGINQTTWAPWDDKRVTLCVVNGELLPINARKNTQTK